jgi:hypothetical protein
MPPAHERQLPDTDHDPEIHATEDCLGAFHALRDRASEAFQMMTMIVAEHQRPPQLLRRAEKALRCTLVQGAVYERELGRLEGVTWAGSEDREAAQCWLQSQSPTGEVRGCSEAGFAARRVFTC